MSSSDSVKVSISGAYEAEIEILIDKGLAEVSECYECYVLRELEIAIAALKCSKDK